MDLSLIESLLANVPGERAEFQFLLRWPTDEGDDRWGVREEVRIHQRMFDPGDVPPGDAPVPQELRITAVNVSLTQATPWTERPEYYWDPASNPGGLDATRWRAVEARVETWLFLDVQTGTDIIVGGDAIFTVIEDLAKNADDEGKFLLYLWEDADDRGVEIWTWSWMKKRYR